MMTAKLPITQHIHFGLTPLPFGTLLPTVATSYMLGTLSEIQKSASIGGKIFNRLNNIKT
jgi:hypothetical protein